MIRDQIVAEQQRIVGLIRTLELEKRFVDAQIKAGVGTTAQLRNLEQQSNTIETVLTGLIANAEALAFLLSGRGARLLPRGGDDDAKKELEALRAAIRIEMAQITRDLRITQAELDDALDRNTISITEHAAGITRAFAGALVARTDAQARLLAGARGV